VTSEVDPSLAKIHIRWFSDLSLFHSILFVRLSPSNNYPIRRLWELYKQMRRFLDNAFVRGLQRASLPSTRLYVSKTDTRRAKSTMTLGEISISSVAPLFSSPRVKDVAHFVANARYTSGLVSQVLRTAQSPRRWSFSTQKLFLQFLLFE
jgi:hypothetical protein